MLIKYLVSKKYLLILIGYFLFSTVLKSLSIVDITIPCLWTLLFEVHCPGCGLTTAFVELLKMNFSKAWDINALIFIIAPSILFFLIVDYLNFKNKSR